MRVKQTNPMIHGSRNSNTVPYFFSVARRRERRRSAGERRCGSGAPWAAGAGTAAISASGLRDLLVDLVVQLHERVVQP